MSKVHYAEKYKILDVQWKEARMFGSSRVTLLSGHLGYSGTLQLLLDKRPATEDFTYKRYDYKNYNRRGNCKMFFAESNGFVRIYLYQQGTTQGFAGAEITLKFEDGEETFKGSLWDPTGYDDTSMVPEYRAVAYTDKKEDMERGYTFYAGYVTKELYDELIGLCENCKTEPVVDKGVIC